MWRGWDLIQILGAGKNGWTGQREGESGSTWPSGLTARMMWMWPTSLVTKQPRSFPDSPTSGRVWWRWSDWQIRFQDLASFMGLPGWLSGKEFTCNAGTTGNAGWIPWSRKSPGGGHGNPLQYLCLENPMCKGAWGCTVHGVTKSWTQLKWLNMCGILYSNNKMETI